jgi:hypothetical protein
MGCDLHGRRVLMIQFKAMDRQEEWDWIWERAYPLRTIDTQGIVAYDGNGKICAMVVMDSWTPSGCQTHFAIDNPMAIKAGLFQQVAIHIHVTAGRRYIFGLIPADNEKAHKFDLKMGFKEVARVPDGYREGVDYIVVRLAKEDNPWLPEQFKTEAA